jgi:prepilin-type N-terminal cleavage/methylation domain-containing protein
MKSQDRTHLNNGFTLIEMIVGMALFMIIMVIIFSIFRTFTSCWKVAESKNEVHRQFLKVMYNFDKEISRTSLDTMICGTYGGQNWVCFKSPIDQDGNPVYLNDGMPDWQKYIIYYTVRPPDDGCTAATGLDTYCPHKYVIRKDVGINAPLSTPGGVPTYLTFTLTANQAAGEPYILYVKPLSNNILEMSFNKDSNKAYLHVKILRISEAEQHLRIGSVPLSSDTAQPYINQIVWSVMPKNKQY